MIAPLVVVANWPESLPSVIEYVTLPLAPIAATVPTVVPVDVFSATENE